MINRTRIGIAGLVLSASGLVFTVGQEGFTDHAVQPVKNDKWTIGFGTTEGVKPGDKITPVAALTRAARDISIKYEGPVKQCVHVPLTQYEYDIYIDFAYNVGVGNFCGSTMVKLLNAGDYTAACAQFPRWFMYQGHDCRAPENQRLCGGLVTRRAEAQAKCEGQ